MNLFLFMIETVCRTRLSSVFKTCSICCRTDFDQWTCQFIIMMLLFFFAYALSFNIILSKVSVF